MHWAASRIDIAVATERLKGQLRVFRIAPEVVVSRMSHRRQNTRVFADRAGEQAAPMGVSLYRRPRDGAMFAIVAPKNGPREGYLGQYRLEHDGQRASKGYVRSLLRSVSAGQARSKPWRWTMRSGTFTMRTKGTASTSITRTPIIEMRADELAHFGRTGFRADREGIAIYAGRNGTGYIVCTDQLAGNSEYHVYRREGESGGPHDHSTLVKIVRGGADSTDGLEITSRPLGPKFPRGLMVAMNSAGRNFLLYSWDDVMPRP